MVSQYDCLIHPAICMEIFGLNIAEALHQKKYVIATKCGGAEMQIHDNKDGQLIPPNNVTALYEALTNYINNPHQSISKVMSIEEHTSKLLNAQLLQSI